MDWTALWGASFSRLASAPSVEVTPSETEVFWQGADKDLWEAAYSFGAGWGAPVDRTAGWGSPAAQLASAPSVGTTPSGQIIVFWQGTNGDLWQAWHTPSSVGWIEPVDWTAAWGATAARLASAPSLDTTLTGQTVVFWQGTNDHLWEAWYVPRHGWNTPVDWTAQLGDTGPLTSGPAVVRSPTGQTLVFWQGTDDHLWQAWYSPGIGWRGPVDWTAQWASSANLGSGPSVSTLTHRGACSCSGKAPAATSAKPSTRTPAAVRTIGHRADRPRTRRHPRSFTRPAGRK